MDLTFEIAGRIGKPVKDVFEAVADPASLSAYFTTGGAKGRLETGATVYWEFHDYPGAFPVEIIEATPDERIVIRWDSADHDPEAHPDAAPDKTIATIRFEALEGERTLVSISEEGWRETPEGLKASYGNCMGWTQMLCALKAWLEYGVVIRKGMWED